MQHAHHCIKKEERKKKERISTQQLIPMIPVSHFPRRDYQRKTLANFAGDSNYLSRIIKVVITS